MNIKNKSISRGALGLAALAGISLMAGGARAQDDPATMAPPVESSVPYEAGVPYEVRGTNGTNAAADSVFNWQEIPANQQVPLSRAAFDQGGYQLYDTVGETIIVPFTNRNLYVMKFAESPTGRLYFVNEGGYPVLYVPRGGYLNNASVSGARWYPFGENYHPSEPIFLGIAPSYNEFVDLGWYSNTFEYGGYCGHTSFVEGGLFLPTTGLFFEVGGRPYYGWNGYHHYYEGHEGYEHVGYFDRDYYHYAGRQYRQFAPERRFDGGWGGDSRGGGDHRGGGYNVGEGHSFGGDRSGGFGGRPSFSGQSSDHGGRTFRGSANYVQGGHRNSGGDRNSGDYRNSIGNPGGGWNTNSNHNYSGQTFSGRSFRGSPSSGDLRGSGGGQNYSRPSFGGGQSYSRPSFGGGQSSHSLNGGGQSRGGDRGGSRGGWGRSR